MAVEEETIVNHLTSEEQVQKNKEDILVLTNHVETLEEVMKSGLKRVEGNQKTTDGRLWAILVLVTLGLVGIAGQFIVALIKT